MYFQSSPLLGRWGVRLGLAGVVVGGAITSLSFVNAFGSTALAQVVADPTLGSVVTDTGGGVQTITDGTRQGNNLFHSFQQFSVPTNGTAFFNNALDIQNILTRVTGSSRSEIDGLIRANGAANLFLLNPNGIIFGQNARLNIGGSFVATTANSINFADGVQFSVTPGAGAPLLTVSVPLGLQFGTGAGEIVNRANGAGLQVGAGRTLGLIGGNVNLEGGRLTARGGRIELGAVATPKVVGISPDNSGFRFSFPTDLALGDISLIANTSVSPPRPTLVDVRAGSGGSIAVNARNLNLFGGSELVAGIGQGLGSFGAVAGDIEINAQGLISIDGTGQFPDGVFSSGIFNNVNRSSTGKGGNINIKTGSLSLTNDGAIAASVFGIGDAGSVNITARDGVSLDNSTIFSRVRTTGRGNGGNITIQARSLSLSNGAVLTASTLGQGDAGNVLLRVDNSLSLVNSDIFSSVADGAVGNGGTIDIKAGTLSLRDGAQIIGSLERASGVLPGGRGNGGKVVIDVRGSFSASGSNNRGNPSAVFTRVGSGAVGKGGNVEIKAGELLLDNGARIDASTLGTGDAGNVLLRVDNSLSLVDSNIFSNVTAGAVGNGGTIDIKAGTLSLRDGAQILASLEDATTRLPGGRGNGGRVTIDVRDSFSASGRNTDGFPSGVFTSVGSGAVGKGGTIDIKAGTLDLSDGARLTTATFGTGDAGNVNITSDGRVTLDRSSRILSFVGGGGKGQGGDINIAARSLSLNDESSLIASTLGQGNAGNIQINVADFLTASRGSTLETDSFSTGSAGNITITAGGRVAFDAAGNERITSGIFGRLQQIQEPLPDNPNGQIPQIPSNRRGGDINIKARSLSLTNGAQIGTVTVSQGNAGNINIDVDDTVSFDGRGRFDEGTFSSGVFSNVQRGGRGKGGSIRIKAGTLSLANDGIVTASNFFGEGDAGNIDIDVRSLNLDAGAIFAQSTSGDGGDIRLQASKSVRLRNGSAISTSAGTQQQPGDGGNITIDSPLVIANSNGNNDITANAFRGRGGRIEINAQSIIGLTPRNFQELQSLLGTDTPTAADFLNALNNSPTNDVAAISLTNPSLGGTVSFNAADIDPSRDIVELPEGLVDASGLVASGCPSGAENRFTVTGRGGLPPAPGDKLSPDALLTDWATLTTPETGNRAAVETTLPEATHTTPTPLVEATSWQFDRDGAIILTSGNATTSSDRFEATPTSCPSS
jgi:filamentous hemagglutinin family protein